MSVFLVKEKVFQAHELSKDTFRGPLVRWKVGVNKICLMKSMMAHSPSSSILQGSLWSQLEKLLETAPIRCPYLVARFRQHIHISGVFLAEMVKERKLKLKMTIEFENKVWTFDFTVNAKGHGVLCKKLARREKSEFRQAVTSGKGKLTVELIFGNLDGVTQTPPAFLVSPQQQTTMFVRKMFEEQIQCDVHLMSENGTAFPCHKAFLAGNSAWFNHLFTANPQEKTWKISLTEEGLRAFLKYVYYADVEDPKKNQKVAVELLKIGNKYSIVPMERDMKNMLLELSTSALDVVSALQLFCFARKVKGYEDLKMKAIKQMKWNFIKVSKSSDLQRVVGNDPSMLKELDSIGLYK